MKLRESLARAVPKLLLPRLYHGTCNELYRLKNTQELEPEFYVTLHDGVTLRQRKILEPEFHFTSWLERAVLHAQATARDFEQNGYDSLSYEPIVLELTSLAGLEVTIFPPENSIYRKQWVIRGKLNDNNSQIRKLNYDKRKNAYVLQI